MSNVYDTGIPKWKSGWEYDRSSDRNGVPYSNLANAYHALSEAPEIRDLFTMGPGDTIEIEKQVPVYADDPLASYPKRLEDVDVFAIQVWLQCAGLRHLSTETTRQAIAMRAAQRQWERS